MEVKVPFSEDPAFVLRTADEFLSSEPVLHNLILSILHSRVALRSGSVLDHTEEPRRWFSLRAARGPIGVRVAGYSRGNWQSGSWGGPA
jgi:hypothetical protein